MPGLTVIKPVVMTDAQLLGTDVPEADHAAWLVGTTYAAKDRVIVLATHTIYESLQASNIGKDPTLSANALWWVRVKPTNRWGALDLTNSTGTTQASSMFYRFTPATLVNAVFLLGMVNVTTVRIRQIHPSLGTVYDVTASPVPMPVSASWYDWYYGGRAASTQLVKLDLFAFPDCELRLDFTGGAAMTVGTLAFGYQQTFGMGVNYGARLGIIDYSKKVTNDFGDVTFVVRAFAKKASFSMMLENQYIDAIQTYLASLRATPCLWIGTSQYESTIVFGFFRDFNIQIAYSQHSTFDIELEGLT